MLSSTHINANLRRLMYEKRMSGRELCRLSGLKPPQVSSLRHETVDPRVSTLLKVAVPLGVGVDALLAAPDDAPEAA